MTSGFDRAGQASFSKDMRWMVFQARRRGEKDYRIYLAKLLWDSSDLAGIDHPIPVTPTPARSTSGCISSDGLSLIFASNAGSASAGSTAPMKIFRADGWEGAVSMTNAAMGIDLAQHSLTATDISSTDCSYSPDGKWICFTSRRPGGSGIYVMHADGSHVVQISKNSDSDAGPSFSPDGKQLVYRGEHDTAKHEEGKSTPQIFVADLALDQSGEITGITSEQQLTHDDNANDGPCWHPDGQHIIYATSLNGRNNYELYIMTRNGRHKTRITFSPGADLFPAFSPDGKYLMWTSKRSKDETMQVFVAKFQFPRGS